MITTNCMYSHAILLPVTPLPGSLNLIVTSPLKLIYIFLNISYETLVLYDNNKLYLIEQSILLTCLLHNKWENNMLITCVSLRVKLFNWITCIHFNTVFLPITQDKSFLKSFQSKFLPCSHFFPYLRRENNSFLN